MLATYNRPAVSEPGRYERSRQVLDVKAWVLPVLLLVALLSTLILAPAAQAPGGQPGADSWSCSHGTTLDGEFTPGSVDVLPNNQVPGNKILKNGATSPLLIYRVENADGTPATSWYDLFPGEESAPFGVGLGQKILIKNYSSGTNATGTVRAASA